MFEIIPSEGMRKYLDEIGRELTDYEKVTIIYNSTHTVKEIWECLLEVAESTTDERTKQQVNERVHYEQKQLELLKNNQSKNYVYVVQDKDGYGCGYFWNFDMAMRYVVKNNLKYEIEKQLIVGDELPMVACPGRCNPNLFDEPEEPEMEEYGGNAVAGVSLDGNGEIARIWSSEMPEEEEKAVDSFRRDRFESRFINIPFYFKKGEIVKDHRTGEYGIVATSKEHWNKFEERIANGLYVDWSDMSIVVLFITDEGTYIHNHINPIYLDYGWPEGIDDRKRPLEALGDYLLGKGKEEIVLRVCKEYKAKKQNERNNRNLLEQANTVRDIIF